MTQPADQSPLDYYLIVSQHNLAELQACLYLKPQRIILITTQSMQERAERLKKILAQRLQGSEIEILHEQLEGNRVKEIREWVRNTLNARLRAGTQAGRRQILNMTGGNKIISLILSNLDTSAGVAWEALHYQSIPDEKFAPQIEVFQIYERDFRLQEPIDLSAVQVPPLDALCLYMDNPENDHPKPWESSALALQLAQERLDASLALSPGAGQPQPEHPWRYLTPWLEQHWFEEGKKNHSFELHWHERDFPEPLLRPLLARLQQLQPELQPLTFTAQGVRFPSGVDKDSVDWRKWICGIWYEQLVLHWLEQCGIRPDSYVPNVHVRDHKRNDTHEIDILLLRHNKFQVIEIKADLPKGKKLSEFEKAITSASSLLSTADKYLILSPHLRYQGQPVKACTDASGRQTSRQWQDFEDRCKLLGITLITPSSREDLRQGLKLPPPPGADADKLVIGVAEC